MPSFERAQLLIQQKRFDLAERELRGILAEDPDQAEAHSYLALCLLEDDRRWREAVEEAKVAVGLEPDSGFTHYCLGSAYLKGNRTAEARISAKAAIQIDPYNEGYFGLLAGVELVDRKWQAALDAATAGLAIDADDLQCNNIRSVALERLGRSNEAVVAARSNLRRAPDDSMAHAAMGWTALNSGKYQQAQDSFREALRLDPNNEMAKSGMISALNSRSIVFRSVYRFYAWISRFGSQYQFAIIFGAWFVMRGLSALGNRAPALKWLTTPILLLYLLFVILSWIATPLFNTFLRFHSFGRHLLDRQQIWASNFLAMCVAAAIVGGAVGFWRLGDAGLFVFGYWIMMMIPVAMIFQQETTQRMIIAIIAGVAVGLIPVVGILQSYFTESVAPLSRTLPLFSWSILGIQILGNVLQTRVVRKS